MLIPSVPLLLLLGFQSLLLFISFSIYIISKYKEKMRIIENGDFAYAANAIRSQKYSFLSKGILFVSLSIGSAIAYFSTKELDMYLICWLGSGGVGLLIYYFVIRKTS